jgi:hypothetical protein
LEVIVPGLIIYSLLQTYISPPNDLSRTIFTVSAPTLAVILAATTFVYNQFDRQIAESHSKAVNYDIIKRQRALKKEEKDNLDLALSPLYAPKLLAQIIIRSLLLILISTVISGIDFFGNTSGGIFVAITALILFVINLAYLIFASLVDLFQRILFDR